MGRNILVHIFGYFFKQYYAGKDGKKKKPKGCYLCNISRATTTAPLHARSFSNNMQMLLSFLHELERMPLQALLYTMLDSQSCCDHVSFPLEKSDFKRDSLLPVENWKFLDPCNAHEFCPLMKNRSYRFSKGHSLLEGKTERQ